MDALGLLLLIVFVLLSLLTRGAGQGGSAGRGPGGPGPWGGGPRPGGRSPGDQVPGSGGPRRQPSSGPLDATSPGPGAEASAADMVPDDLWEVLTGEARRSGSGGGRRTAPMEGAAGDAAGARVPRGTSRAEAALDWGEAEAAQAEAEARRASAVPPGSRVKMPPRSSADMAGSVGASGSAEAVGPLAQRAAARPLAAERLTWRAPQLPDRPTLAKRPSQMRKSLAERRVRLDTAGMPLPDTEWRGPFAAPEGGPTAGQGGAGAARAGSTDAASAYSIDEGGTSAGTHESARARLGLDRRSDARRAFVLAEVLGPPRSMD